MILTKETIYTKDEANKKIRIEREFDAPLPMVWRAWTEKELLDQWWAPLPWKAHTTYMDFREGGRWLYHMEGPDGECHYCRVDYTSIQPNHSYAGLDCFCDEKGDANELFPGMQWHCQFSESGAGTKVEIEVTFSSLEEMEKIVEMGFKEGFAAAHINLDSLLKTINPG